MTLTLHRRSRHVRDLIRELIVRDVRLRYRRSVLGLLWSQIGPISMIVILTILFTRIIPLEIENYPVFVYIGLASWQWFQGGLVFATTSVTDNRDLIRQPTFPPTLLPVVAIGSQLVHYVLGLPVLLVAVLMSTGRLPATAICLPLLLVIQFALCLGPAYLLAALHVTLRDTAEVVGLVLRLAFYATPIIYDEARLIGSRFEFIYRLNPFARLITAQRDVLLRGRWPDLDAMIVILLGSLVLVALGARRFASASARFPEEV